jgi:hypothetical protein
MAHAQKILKFSLGNAKKDTVIIFETVTENDDRARSEVEIGEEVHPDLHPLLAGYLKMAIYACRNDIDAWASGRVTGVSFKHDEKGIGATFSLQLQTDDGPISDNTPYQSADKLDPQKIMALHLEIVQCLNGKRAYEQGVLDLAKPPQPIASTKTKTKIEKASKSKKKVAA